MLSHEDNELMCRVGPGTPMGTALRRYWIPALQTSDLAEPGGGGGRRGAAGWAEAGTAQASGYRASLRGVSADIRGGSRRPT